MEKIKDRIAFIGDHCAGASSISKALAMVADTTPLSSNNVFRISKHSLPDITLALHDCTEVIYPSRKKHRRKFKNNRDRLNDRRFHHMSQCPSN